MELNTDNKRQGCKRLLRRLSLGPVDKQKATHILTVERGDKDRIYKQTENAKTLVKNLVNSDRFPIESHGNELVRTDIEGVS